MALMNVESSVVVVRDDELVWFENTLLHIDIFRVRIEHPGAIEFLLSFCFALNDVDVIEERFKSAGN